jgi:hypothetical protein
MELANVKKMATKGASVMAVNSVLLLCSRGRPCSSFPCGGQEHKKKKNNRREMNTPILQLRVAISPQHDKKNDILLQTKNYWLKKFLRDGEMRSHRPQRTKIGILFEGEYDR